MKTSDFNYELPHELIAQTPLKKRSESRLMIADYKHQQIWHQHFSNIVDYLTDQDVLVINNSKVIPARLFGIKAETGAKVELLILKITNDVAHCIVGNAKVVKLGSEVVFGDGLLKARCIKVEDEGIRDFKLIYDGILVEILDVLGQMPLPPYIHETLRDKNRYQTVYAKIDGSAAAPTAGLHFTQELLQQISTKGVTIVEITLHVGLGTFRPVKVDDIANHHMHHEDYQVSELAAQTLNLAKQQRKRIISVGTTTTRVLETQMQRYGKFVAEMNSTDIFLYPGCEFKAIDALITNFHLPASTLLMLVSAFTSREFMLDAYRQAVQERYRFFSFGDAMLIVR